ncbi:hypothetical protein BD560DRAFT_424793 [Blakeslea trispora]|nr:hypothetical protein BD560DRAFT_424793 [Blakeslea trispora]
MKQQKMTSKRLHAKQENKPPFVIEDLVLCCNDAVAEDLGAKIQDCYSGPFVVQQSFDNSIFSLKTLQVQLRRQERKLRKKFIQQSVQHINPSKKFSIAFPSLYKKRYQHIFTSPSQFSLIFKEAILHHRQHTKNNRRRPTLPVPRICNRDSYFSPINILLKSFE